MPHLHQRYSHNFLCKLQACAHLYKTHYLIVKLFAKVFIVSQLDQITSGQISYLEHFCIPTHNPTLSTLYTLSKRLWDLNIKLKTIYFRKHFNLEVCISVRILSKQNNKQGDQKTSSLFQLSEKLPVVECRWILKTC